MSSLCKRPAAAMLGQISRSTTMKCTVVAAGVFVLWLLLAGDAAPATIAAGLIVAAAASAWALLLDR